MIYVDLNQLSLPKKLKQDLETAADKLFTLPENEQKDYIKSKSNLWSRVKPYLAKVLCKCGSICHQKCWYCEVMDIRFDYQVDHFRPKFRVKNKGSNEEPGYWWLAFKVSNYRLCCSFCNSPHTDEEDVTRGKWDQFPLAVGSIKASWPADNTDDEVHLLLDPTRMGDPILLAFSEDGRVYPRYSNRDFLKLRAEVTIDVLNLNDVRIEEARRRLWRDCIMVVEEGREALHRYALTHGSATAGTKFEAACHKIREMISDCSEFSAMARYCFRGTGEDWVLDLL